MVVRLILSIPLRMESRKMHWKLLSYDITSDHCRSNTWLVRTRQQTADINTIDKHHFTMCSIALDALVLALALNALPFEMLHPENIPIFFFRAKVTLAWNHSIEIKKTKCACADCAGIVYILAIVWSMVYTVAINCEFGALKRDTQIRHE